MKRVCEQFGIKRSFPPGAWPGRYGGAGADDAIRCGIRVTKTRFLLVSGSLTITGVGANGRILERAGLRSNLSHSGQDFLVPETRWRDIGWLPVLWPSELLDPQRLRSPVSGGWISRHKKTENRWLGFPARAGPAEPHVHLVNLRPGLLNQTSACPYLYK